MATSLEFSRLAMQGKRIALVKHGHDAAADSNRLLAAGLFHRFLDRLVELDILFAGSAANAADFRKLLLGQIDLAHGYVTFTKVFARLGIIRIESDRLPIITDGIIELSKLAIGVAEAVQHLWIILAGDRAEEEPAGLELALAGQRPGLFDQLAVGKHPGFLLDALLLLFVPHVTGLAGLGAIAGTAGTPAAAGSERRACEQNSGRRQYDQP